MYCAFFARTLLLPERTTVETGMCIAEQFLAIRAKIGVLLFLSAVDTNHQLHYLLLMRNALFLPFHIMIFFDKDNN